MGNYRDHQRAWRLRNPEYDQHQKLQSRYGISLDEYRAMVDQQAGRCAACRAKPNSALHVDHDHQTGKIRGLLCGPCNRALGILADDPDRLRQLLDYLEG